MALLKNKSLFALIFLPGIIFLFSCKKYSLKAINDDAVALYDCSPKSTEPYICFDSLIQDSRCPKPAVCFWSGTAIIKVSFHEGNHVHTFKMSLKDFPSLGYPADTTVAGYRIEFTGLVPYPDTNAPVLQPSDIRATIKVYPG